MDKIQYKYTVQLTLLFQSFLILIKLLDEQAPPPLLTISLIDTTQLPSSIIIDMVINKPPFPPYHIALLFLRLLSSSCIFFFLLLFSSCCVGRSRSLGQDFFTLQKLQTSSWILLTKLQILYFNMYVLGFFW